MLLRFRLLFLAFGTYMLFFGCTIRSTDHLVYSHPDVEQQAKNLQKVSRSDKNNVSARIELARLLISEGYSSEAIIGLDNAIEIDSSEVDAYVLLASALQQTREPNINRALFVLQGAQKTFPDNYDVLLGLSYIYMELSQNEQAIEQFKKVIKTTDDFSATLSAHLGLASLYKRQGLSENAEAELSAARNIYPDVDRLLRKIEIDAITPSPQWSRGEFTTTDSGFHPSFETRMRLVLEEINRNDDKGKHGKSKP